MDSLMFHELLLLKQNKQFRLSNILKTYNDCKHVLCFENTNTLLYFVFHQNVFYVLLKIHFNSFLSLQTLLKHIILGKGGNNEYHSRAQTRSCLQNS